VSRQRSNLGMGDRLRWCQDARPEDWRVKKRAVAAAAQKCVLWALTNRSNADGSSFPRQELLAEETGLKRQSVNAALQALAEQDFLSIEIDPDHRRSRRYILNMSRPATHRSEGSASGTGDASDQGVHTSDVPVEVLPDDLSRPATRQSEGPVAPRDTDLSPHATPIEPPVEPRIESPSDSLVREAFDRFWIAYPRKVGKRKAHQAWLRAIRRASVSAIFAGAERYRDDPNRDPAFTAHATTWLNRDGWDDEPLPVRISGRRPDRAAEIVRNALAKGGGDGQIRSGGPGGPTAGVLPSA
jgi:Helix-turn-helix domain